MPFKISRPACQAPPIGPWIAIEPKRTADHDADRAPEPGRQRQEQTETVNAERADRIADGIAEEGVLVFRRLHHVARLRVGGRQNETAVQRKRETRREEERDRDHVRRIVVEVAVLVAGVRHPIEMAHECRTGRRATRTPISTGRMTTSVK